MLYFREILIRDRYENAHVSWQMYTSQTQLLCFLGYSKVAILSSAIFLLTNIRYFFNFYFLMTYGVCKKYVLFYSKIILPSYRKLCTKDV